MPRSANQKLKLLCLCRILWERTDEDHPMTVPELIQALEAWDIKAERKSIYDDMEALRTLGIDVQSRKGKSPGWFLGERTFQLAELKLLVDAIQSSRFITAKKSNELIRKLESLVSEYEARELQRQVYVSGRIKTMNESIYYTVDAIYSAIASNRKILFQYFQWNAKKEMELRHGGAVYKISPWGLAWDNENYYLVGYDSEADMIKHYRVDKMLRIRMSDEEREGRERFRGLDMAAYTKKSFGMFGGREEQVKLLVHNRRAGVIIDRFGKDIMMKPADEEHFTVHVDVAVSGQFISWVFSLGDEVKILGPEPVVEQVHREIRRLTEQYGV